MLRRSVVKIVAVLVAVLLGWMARLPDSAMGSEADLRARFAFSASELSTVATHGRQGTRTVAESHRNISAWLSAVGAAVALADVDGNGREDDYCLVDPRTDTATVASAPGTGTRFPAFALSVDDLPYDRSRIAPMGCLPLDLNADGSMDILTYYWGRSPVLFLSTGATSRLSDASFVELEVLDGPADWATDSVAAADVDGSGTLDLIVGNYFPDDSGLLAPKGDASQHMQMHSSMSNAQNGGGARILLQTSAGTGASPHVTFEEAENVIPERARDRWTLAVGTQDLNKDSLPEIYLSNDFGPDSLLINTSSPGEVKLTEVKGDRSFSMPKSKVLGYDSFKGMGVDFADMNGDGRTDMFVSNLTSPLNLVESNLAFINDGSADDSVPGRAPFHDASDQMGLSRSGWSWDVKFGDFDNDSTPELLQAAGFVIGEKNRWPQLQELALANDLISPYAELWPTFNEGVDLSGKEKNRFWVKGDARWSDAAEAIGVDQSIPSRGFATADIDSDGRLDFAVANQWGDSYLYRNDCSRCGRSLGLRLRRDNGEGGTTLAYGAAATVTLPSGDRLTAQVDAGNGHASTRGNELHFGLGDIDAGDQLEVAVTWRDINGTVHSKKITLSPGHHDITLKSGENR